MTNIYYEVELTNSGRPNLKENEIECQLITNVEIEYE
jgi:hypothetical protein